MIAPNNLPLIELLETFSVRSITKVDIDSRCEMLKQKGEKKHLQYDVRTINMCTANTMLSKSNRPTIEI